MKPSFFLKSLAAVSIVAVGALASSAAWAVKVGPVEDPIRVVKIAKGAPIVIATYHVISGADTALGLDAQRGAVVAADDLGNKLVGHPIKFMHEDDGCNAEGGQTAATKIAANQQVVVAIGGACSSATRPAAPILWKAGIPDVATAASSPVLTAPDRGPSYDGLLRIVYNDLWAGREVANWAYKVRGYKRAATIHDGSPYAEKLVRVFQENFKKLGGEIVSDEAIAPNDTDMRPVLTKIATSKPDFIYAPTFVGATSYLIRQKKEIPGLEKVALIGSDASMGAQLMEAAGKDLLGFEISTTAMEPEAQGPGYTAMREKYKKMFGEYPIQGFHGNGYDAMMLAANAIKKVAITEKDGTTYIPIKALRDAMFATKNMQGVTGKITCDQYGDCGVYNFAIYQYTNPDPKTLEPGKNPKRIYPDKF
ncbi:MAG: branched-chain amino acid ABC transporter substrate-binding protein [Alphaproteobacteria bacterium]|nr:branched-chain amino acid ABC transporter substrate-binding protein [Alphaproteobacteria bacterium]